VVAIAISIAIVVPVSVPIAVPVTIMLAAVVHAAKLAIDIFNRAAATGEGFEMSIHPLAVAVLAASAQIVKAHANFTAGLVVSAAGHRAIFVANQAAIIVGNVAPAAVGSIQKRIMIVSASVLATSAQVIAPQAYVFAGLLVRTCGIVIHRNSAGFLGPKDQNRAQSNQRKISH
jgi:hypothetical protein